MRAMQDPITQSVADKLGMTPEEAEAKPRTAARRAAAVLRANGYTRKQYHVAWERGMRWFAPGASVPTSDRCSTTILAMAMLDGKIR